MNQSFFSKRLFQVAAVVAILLLALLGFWFWQLSAANTPKKSPDQKTATTSPRKPTTEIKIDSAEVAFVASYTGGGWQYSGVVQLPDPCTQLSTDTIIAESFPEQVRVVLETKQDSSTFCAQVITSKSFSGQFSASERASVSVFLNGRIVR